MPLPRLFADDIGQPQISGATVVEGSSVMVTAGGADIWGSRDECQFAYLTVAGNFDMSVRVAGLEMADLYTKAGLMLRAALDDDAPHAMLLTFGDNQPRNKNNGALEFQSRLVAGGDCTGIYPPQPLAAQPQFPASFPQHWLRLTRRNDVLTGLFCTDGRTWQTFCTHVQVFPATALLGLAVTSHNTARAVRASFHDLTLNQGSNG